jgi:hypothetical protein
MLLLMVARGREKRGGGRGFVCVGMVVGGIVALPELGGEGGRVINLQGRLRLRQGQGGVRAVQGV